MAHSNRNDAADAGQRVNRLRQGQGQAGLVADVDAAAGLAADETVLPQGPDRVADRDRVTPKNFASSSPEGSSGSGLELPAEDRGADRRGDLHVRPTGIFRVDDLHTC